MARDLRMMRTLGLAAALALAVFLIAPTPARAPPFGTLIDVTTNVDETTADGQCSLREAISAANNNNSGPGGDCDAGTGADGISLHADHYNLSGGAGENSNAGGDLDVSSDLNIHGASAAATTIDAKGIDRVLDIQSGKTVGIDSVTITGGHAPNGTATPSPGTPAEDGGGIRNLGTLSLTDSVVTANSAGNGANGVQGMGPGLGTDGGSGGRGGGIFNGGTLTLTRSAITGNNHAGAGGAGAANSTFPMMSGASRLGGLSGAGGAGGGVGGTGTLNAADSTISGNAAGAGGAGGAATGNVGEASDPMGTGGTGGDGTGGNGGPGGDGGGIAQASVTLTRSTVAGNAAGAGGAGGDGTGGAGGLGGFGGRGGVGTGGNGGAGGRGGGAYSTSSINATNATVESNATGTGGAGGSGHGGTGGNPSAGSTSAGNGGDGRGGNGGSGGSAAGLFVAGGGTLGVLYGTISANSAHPGGTGASGTGGSAGTGPGATASNGNAVSGVGGAAGQPGGVIAPSGGGATLTNTILASNSPSNCLGTFAPASANDISFPADATPCPGIHADPKLGPLQDNGGATLTRLIGLGPAPNAIPGSDPSCTGTDQRGVARPVGIFCDIGAVELRAPNTTTGGFGSLTTATATISGTVNPAGLPTEYHFEYGRTAAYGASTPSGSAGAGTADVPVSATVRGLKAGTIYHYRLVASNSDGTIPGADRTFKTAPDRTPPVIRFASVLPKKFALGGKGTTFTYGLSEPARVVFTIALRKNGRKVGGKCVRQTPANRHKPKCKRFSTVGRFAQSGHSGKNTKSFSGRIGKKALKPGSYRATLVATDPAGNRSKPRTLSFKVVRR